MWWIDVDSDGFRFKSRHKSLERVVKLRRLTSFTNASRCAVLELNYYWKNSIKMLQDNEALKTDLIAEILNK